MYIFVPPQLSVTVKSFGNDWVEGRNWIGAEQGGGDDFWAGNFRESGLSAFQLDRHL